MISNHSQFLDAIREKNRVRIEFYSSPDAGTVDRECAPLDYGAEPGAKDGMNRYWVWDFASTAGANPLGLLPGQIVGVQILGTTFEPDTLALGARQWTVPRPWSAPGAENPPRTALPWSSPAHRQPA
jgi:hypothetical protein